MDENNAAVLRAIVEYVQTSECVLEVKVMREISWPDLMALQKQLASDVKFRTIWVFPTENEVGVTIVRVDFGGNVACSVATEKKLQKIRLLMEKSEPQEVGEVEAGSCARFASAMNWSFWVIGNRTVRLQHIPLTDQIRRITVLDCSMLAIRQYLQNLAFKEPSSECSVLIVCGEWGSGKLTKLVHCLLGLAGKSKSSYRMICVLQEEVEILATVYRLAAERQESVGSTIGYKLLINAQVGEMNNIVFCTAQTLIQSLIIKTFDEIAPKLTHLIVDCSDKLPEGMNLLFSLVKTIMAQNTEMKLVLLCTKGEVQSWSEFFTGAQVCHLPYNEPTVSYAPNKPYGVEYYHLDWILDTICTHDAIQRMKERLPKVENALKLAAHIQLMYGHCGLNQSARNMMDKLLKDCWDTDNTTPFTAILLPLLKHNRHMVDYQHSDTRLTALMIAGAKGFVDVVRSLLDLGANPYIVGRKSLLAMDWCSDGSDNPCRQLMQTAHESYRKDATARQSLLCQTYHKLYNPYVVDQHLVVDIVVYIVKKCVAGNVLVVLPHYTDVLECLLLLRRNDLERCGKVELVALHSLITEEEFKEHRVYLPINSSKASKMRCVFLLAGASLLELVPSLTAIDYVVDTGLKMHHAGDYAQGICMDQSCLATARTCRLFMWLAQRKYFMLYGKDRLTSDPLQPLPLKEVSCVTDPETILTALLCRTDTTTPTVEYLCSTLYAICPTSVGSSLKLLHQVGAIERPLTVPTSLGLLLSQLGVGIHLGKTLLYAILFRCVDPVLTIIASLKVGNPFTEPLDEQGEQEIVQLKLSLHGRTYSDCMVLLRLYQQWSQCKSMQTDERIMRNYHLKTGAMEAISNARVELMSMLRVLGIVKCGKSHNVEALNINSMKWALVKCCLAAGFYPQLAIADYEKQLLTTNCGSESFKPHRLSVVQIDTLPAKWVLYTRKLEHMLKMKKVDSPPAQLLENTVISDWTVLLVCGIDRYDTLDNGNMQQRVQNACSEEQGMVEFIIDRKYTFQLPLEYYRTVEYIRRELGRMFVNFTRNLLKTFEDKQTDVLVNCIGDILHQEDVSSMIAYTIHDARPKIKNSLPMAASWNCMVGLFDKQ
ncbi:3'-5' RNA helicase YTHDC2-like [Anopheles maculipalpis]|uniref:3'-5' RNA helicase YTHDC2-like n=1 Tax=Anopheles maculipalpis TaxID=1496333 RepID=UPI0021597114|nr:3'-5' RNA helicase YTHDC2-like [Anopheles maculipalpis]